MMVVPGSIPKMMRSLAIRQDEKPAKITENVEPFPAIVDFCGILLLIGSIVIFRLCFSAQGPASNARTKSDEGLCEIAHLFPDIAEGSHGI